MSTKQSAIEAAAQMVERMQGAVSPYYVARGAILAYLSAIAEDEASVEAVARGMAFDQDGDGAWPHDWDAADQDQYRNLARAVLRTLPTRTQGEV